MKKVIKFNHNNSLKYENKLQSYDIINEKI